MDTEITDPIGELPVTDPDPVDAKEAARKGFEQRTKAKEVEALRAELDGYKRREDETRKANLTDIQRVTEERDALKAEKEQAAAQRLRESVGKEYKLPDALVSRLVGSDEVSLRADAEELSKLLPRQKLGSVSDPVKDTSGGGRTYKESQLADRTFYKAHEADILQAYREGRIVRD